jgi:hypothetical protein
MTSPSHHSLESPCSKEEGREGVHDDGDDDDDDDDGHDEGG